MSPAALLFCKCIKIYVYRTPFSPYTNHENRQESLICRFIISVYLDTETEYKNAGNILLEERRALSSTCFKLVSCLAYYSTLNLMVIFSSETSIDFQRTARRNIPDDRTLHNHLCERLKSCVISLVSALLILKLLDLEVPLLINLTNLSQLHRLLRTEH
jgi:hypothetical protein